MALRQESHVLVVGGSDSSGGAGIARDIETLSSMGVRSCLAVTAVTVQTHDIVTDILHLQPGLVADQMRAALQANKLAAVKIGMLATAEIVAAVAAVLRENPRIPAVLDPVLASTSGRALLEASAIPIMKQHLMPLCRIVTPNLIELALLAGQQLLAAGVQALLIKGGHGSGPRSTDVLVRPNQEPVRLDTRRLARTMRGTGCALASAIAAYLAIGGSIEEAVRQAKLLVFEKIWKHPI
ncbi:hydroxymethylpyrimidine/phosphomethylpyrimidine kinase [Mesorhizobium sp. M0601]|uniref:hydroxymethylpyrimidine/phosphomethylpyrimidine kinase n=1 Tax=Mesorhizobium sp. M0601 TaxID=2956969 RepID=UPI00333A2B9D